MPSVGVFVCTTEKDLGKVAKHYGIELPILDGMDGQATFVDNGRACFAVVYLPGDLRGRYPRVQLDALIVHESVHVALDFLGHLGEHIPGHELMAYTVQNIAECIMSVYHSDEGR